MSSADPNATANADELATLFPNLTEIVGNWKGGGNGPLQINGETAQVTDEDIQAYFASRPGSMGPRFAAGQGGPPPPPSHVEGGAPAAAGDAPGSLPPQPAPIAAPSVDDGAGGGGPEGGQPTTDQPVDTTLPDEIIIGGKRVPRDKLGGLAGLAELLDQRPDLRNLVAGYLTTGVVPATYASVPGSEGQPSSVVPSQGGGTVQPAVVAPQPSPQPSMFPQIDAAELDLDDPTIRTLWESQQRTQEVLGMIAQNMQAQQAQTVATQQRDANSIAAAAIGKFQTDHELDDDSMNRLRDAAAGLNLVDSFMQGFDPITRLPVVPDPHYAVTRTLEVAYNSIPEFQSREFERRQRDFVEDNARKAKLAAIGGGGAGAPRTRPAPRTAAEATQAMHAEVAEMLAGNWSPPNSQ